MTDILARLKKVVNFEMFRTPLKELFLQWRQSSRRTPVIRACDGFQNIGVSESVQYRGRQHRISN